MSTSQDFRSSVTVIEPTPPVISRGGQLIFVGEPKDPLDLEVRTITSQSDIDTYINDSNEIAFIDNAFIFVPFTDANNIQDQIDLADGRAKTLIMSSSATALMIVTDIKFDGAVVYTVISETPWDTTSFVTMASKKDRCVFIDPELEGKPFFTFSTAITTFPQVGNFIGLKNADFSSVFKTTAIQKLMVDNNFSYYFQPTETPTTECNDVYIGGKQAQVFYQYITVEDTVQNTIYNFVQRNYPYTDDSLAILDNSLSSELQKLIDQTIIEGFNTNVPTVASQLTSDKVKGYIKGFEIEFNELYRIANVSIIIEGVI